MKKSRALELLGGTPAAAARSLGVSHAAISQWPDELPARIAERVLGVVAKTRYPELARELAEPEAAGKQGG